MGSNLAISKILLPFTILRIFIEKCTEFQNLVQTWWTYEFINALFEPKNVDKI